MDSLDVSIHQEESGSKATTHCNIITFLLVSKRTVEGLKGVTVDTLSTPCVPLYSRKKGKKFETIKAV